jgi:hypothetical protein
MARLHGYLGVLLGVLITGLSARGITDQEIEAKFSAMADYQPAPGEAFTEAGFADFLKALVADIRLDDVGIAQLESLTPLFLYHPDTRRRMVVRLEELREDPGVAGARASVMRMALRARGSSPSEIAGVVRETLAHAGMGDSIRAGHASDLFSVLRGLPPEALAPNAEAIAALGREFDASMSRRALAICSDYPVVVGRLAPVLGEERTSRILDRHATLFAAAGSPMQEDSGCAEKTDMQEGTGVVHQ